VACERGDQRDVEAGKVCHESIMCPLFSAGLVPISL
jgi:hypothetical protein